MNDTKSAQKVWCRTWCTRKPYRDYITLILLNKLTFYNYFYLFLFILQGKKKPRKLDPADLEKLNKKTKSISYGEFLLSFITI